MKSKLDRQIENDTKSRKYIIEASNPYKIYWDLLVILSALTTSFFVPVEIAFKEINRTFDSYFFTHILDVSMDIIFLIDIVASFLSEYTDTASGD